MSQNPGNQQVQLTFSDGKTVTMTQSEYQAQLADPLVEVTRSDGTTQVMRTSQFKAMQSRQLDAYQAQMAANIDGAYAAGRGLDSLPGAVSGIGAQVQAALTAAAGALGSGKGATQARGELQQAASALEKGLGAVAQNISTMRGGLISTSSMLWQNEETNLATFGRTAVDPRQGLEKVISMDERGL